MHKTFASTKKIKKLLNYKTKVNLNEGIKRFVYGRKIIIITKMLTKLKLLLKSDGTIWVISN